MKKQQRRIINYKNRTKMLTKEEANHQLQWFELDASGKTLGRFASEIAKILMGKHKPQYTPHIDVGDGVIVTNAKGIRVTGAKEVQKKYYRYSGYIGGLKETPYQEMLEKHPDRIIISAVKGMVPKGKLGRKQMKKLRVYCGKEHDMQAQKPKVANI